jgi:hypothetical protein
MYHPEVGRGLVRSGVLSKDEEEADRSLDSL